MDKIEDFGAHANSYYPLKVEIYKTQTDEQLLDLLWNKYWVATLSQSNILSVSVFKPYVQVAYQYRIGRIAHRRSKI